MGTEARETVIRDMSFGDIIDAAKIESDTFFDAWNESMWLDELNNSLTTYIVLEENGKVIGYAGYWLVAGEAQITRVAVTRDERDRGLGTKLTAALINRAWQANADAITLEVRKGNAAAQKMYLTCGFRAEGVRPNYYADNHEDAVIMWLYREAETHE